MGLPTIHWRQRRRLAEALAAYNVTRLPVWPTMVDVVIDVRDSELVGV